MIERDKIICGDALDKLTTLDAKSVQCCVTSPPYWLCRTYDNDGQLGQEDTLKNSSTNLQMYLMKYGEY